MRNLSVNELQKLACSVETALDNAIEHNADNLSGLELHDVTAYGNGSIELELRWWDDADDDREYRYNLQYKNGVVATSVNESQTSVIFEADHFEQNPMQTAYFILHLFKLLPETPTEAPQ